MTTKGDSFKKYSNGRADLEEGECGGGSQSVNDDFTPCGWDIRESVHPLLPHHQSFLKSFGHKLGSESSRKF